ncbi:MAG: hypothetical protein OXF79_27860 [Chloroflexi bacterium]|nr:hypothetical protein [Chloroflexota bacterium]
MTSRKRSYRNLDNLLAGLEQDILELDDRELDADTGRFFGSGRSARDVIAAGLRSRVSVDRPPKDRGAARAHRRPETPPREAPAVPVPASFSEKRKLLAELLAQRPGIPGQLRMAFSAPRALSDSDVDAMVEKLVRLGILRRDHAEDDDA